MTRTPEALIQPELMTWARKSAGYSPDQAAAKIRVAEERLIAWESGDQRPSIAQLRAAAKVYKRPLAIFYLPEPPVDYQPLTDFRRIPEADLGKLSPSLIATIRRARALRENAIELREIADEPIAASPTLEINSSDPEIVAELARTMLGVDIQDQFGWASPEDALRSWTRAITELDVLVFQAQSIARDEMRGFSIFSDRLPLIVLNGSDFPRGKIFTLLHEFTHVLLHADGVCDVLPRRTIRRPSDGVEVFCNQVAASILMPNDPFRAAAQSASTNDAWDDQGLEKLSSQFAVSQEAVVRRLHGFGLVTWEFMVDKQREQKAAYRDYRARLSGSKGGPSPYTMKIRDLGRDYIELALNAYYQRSITGSVLSEFLEIKVNNVPKLERALAQQKGRMG
ncbi:MAG: XRE family transcriptional regulator [Solirubrobacterales bacterium]